MIEPITPRSLSLVDERIDVTNAPHDPYTLRKHKFVNALFAHEYHDGQPEDRVLTEDEQIIARRAGVLPLLREGKRSALREDPDVSEDSPLLGLAEWLEAFETTILQRFGKIHTV